MEIGMKREEIEVEEDEGNEGEKEYKGVVPRELIKGRTPNSKKVVEDEIDKLTFQAMDYIKMTALGKNVDASESTRLNACKFLVTAHLKQKEKRNNKKTLGKDGSGYEEMLKEGKE